MRNIYTLTSVALMLTLTVNAQKEKRENRSEERVERRNAEKPVREHTPIVRTPEVRNNDNQPPVRKPQSVDNQQVGPVEGRNCSNGNSGNGNNHGNNGNGGGRNNHGNYGNGNNGNNNGIRSNDNRGNDVRNTRPYRNDDRNNNWGNRDNRNNDRRDDRDFRNNERRNDYVSRYGNNGARYNHYDRNYYPDYRRPYTFIGVRYTHFYRPRVSVIFGGFNYYFSDGFFYRPYENYYQVVIAPVGIRVYALPWGYRRWYVGTSLYYYYGGTYYRHLNNYYEVVDAPIGSILPEIPDAAKAVVINGSKYFELSGTYYKETIRNGEVWYTIVGKNGVLNTKYDDIREEADNAIIGDVVTQLPDNYKTIVLNNHKYYVTDNNTYYEEFISDNTVFYKVVAKP